MGDAAEPPYVVHMVSLDDDLWAGFVTTDGAKADEAVRILGDALGLNRVSRSSFCESDLDRWRQTVEIWAADPRITGGTAAT